MSSEFYNFAAFLKTNLDNLDVESLIIPDAAKFHVEAYVKGSHFVKGGSSSFCRAKNQSKILWTLLVHALL